MSNISLSPEKIDYSDFNFTQKYAGKQIHLYKNIDGISQIDCFAILRENAKYIICLMPSAQPENLERSNPIFHRWSWAYQFTNHHVISLSDPALYHANIHAAWFLSNSNIDWTVEIADFISNLAKRLNVAEDKIILYGSSMGGFGALMIASKLKGALAIAEVPQLNLINYPIKSAIKNIENVIFNGEKIQDYSKKFPERLNVFERFMMEKYSPPIRIVTNHADDAFSEHCEFLTNLAKNKKHLQKYGDVDISVIANEIGHKPLPTSYGVGFINSAIAAGWKTTEIKNSDNESQDKYQDLIDVAVRKSANLKYIRSDEELIAYKEIKALLYKAALVNKNADWPYLKICSIVKLWTNSFNDEILTSALAAFDRKESLESFIYACRGFFYNLNLASSSLEIGNLIKKTKDQNIANVGNIFYAIIAYEEGDYVKYQHYIKIFLANKSVNFDPYIAIPVSTVYTDNEYASNAFDCCDVRLIYKSPRLANIEINNEKYIISASCDEVYFFKYANYLVRSFSKICSNEAILHLSVVSGDEAKLRFALQSWGAVNVYLSIQEIDAGVNAGPVASLLRFSHVFSMLRKFKLPVVVLDLDTVIKKSLLDLIENNNKADICSRILTTGVAPWEKYTGGFALFNPTECGEEVAKNIAYIAGKLCSSTEKQWWIDQNCFEAGIRALRQTGKPLVVNNVSSVRDEYCVMPVGSAESKHFCLTNALLNIG